MFNKEMPQQLVDQEGEPFQFRTKEHADNVYDIVRQIHLTINIKWLVSN